MNVIFERGDRDAPVGHALVYFRTETDSVLATYVNVSPIPFELTDLAKFVPPLLAGAMPDMQMTDQMPATPMPPIPKEVGSVEYLHALAAHRHDDLVFAGATMGGDDLRLMQDAAEAAKAYSDLYSAAPLPQPESVVDAVPRETARYAEMTEDEQLRELTNLTGRLRDSLGSSTPDPEIERQMKELAELLPAKYRASDLVEAARTPGERGQKKAALLLERSYKLRREEYLDLERIDREIEAIGD